MNIIANMMVMSKFNFGVGVVWLILVALYLIFGF